eukprot:TRINITY_DN32988_c0_g1_i1.p1 TRINITY_DN32988_c0_g1~~TRINITY_DN32988_c0_g1_i1.p1  ORF type:complete len:1002 (-),score=209.86 TRINITY_DN32988_c0_g1_i1:171-3176(-)
MHFSKGEGVELWHHDDPTLCNREIANKLKVGLALLDHDVSGYIEREKLRDFFRRLCTLSPGEASPLSLLLDEVENCSDGNVHYSSFVDNIFGCLEEPKHGAATELSGAELRTWVSSIRLQGATPSRAALRELLYGDPGNSAKGADIIAVFLTDFPLEGAAGKTLRHLLKDSVDDAESYIFNEDDENLIIEGIPAQLARITSDNKHFYVGMYICVRRHLAQGSVSETFPVPPCLSCGTQDHAGKDLYSYMQSVMLADVFLQAPSNNSSPCPMRVLLCGANLSEDFAAQMKQLRQLERQLDMRRWTGQAFTAVLVGNLSHFTVCGQEFAEFIEEVESNSKHKNLRVEPQPTLYRLNDAGVEEFCRRLDDPAARRNLFLSGSLYFAGTDCFGSRVEGPPPCARMLLEHFELNHACIGGSEVEVPMPSVTRAPMDQLWSEALGFSVTMPTVVTTEMLQRAVQNLHAPRGTVEDLLDFYMPPSEPQNKTHSRVLKTKLGDALYLQMGWLGGIGVYKDSTCPSELVAWDAQEDVFAFDHLPTKGSVSLAPKDGRPLRVWVASVKLDNRKPSREALRALLYGTETNSALGADVIALSLTDLDVSSTSAKELQNLLRNTLEEEERSKYVFNEQEEALVLKAIPAQLVKAESGRSRYVSIHICIKKELVVDSGCAGEVENAFPHIPELVCRSDMKNEAAPSFKGHIAQKVVIKCPTAPGGTLHLMLMGVNFDTEDGARARQAERLLRYLHSFGKEASDRPFAAVIFGDFNNRLVCPEWLSPHVSWKGEGKVKDPVLKISGARILCEKLTSPQQRKELQESLDSWTFQGRDATGAEVSAPEASKELRRHFQLHLDVSKPIVPLPTYKRSSLKEALQKQAGFDLEVMELVTQAQLVEGFRKLQELDAGRGHVTKAKAVYFREKKQANLLAASCPQGRLASQPSLASPVMSDDEDRSADLHAPMLQCGWPDGIGTYKHSVSVRAELMTWGICESITGSIEATPIRGIVRVVLT